MVDGLERRSDLDSSIACSPVCTIYLSSCVTPALASHMMAPLPPPLASTISATDSFVYLHAITFVPSTTSCQCHKPTHTRP
jgi:hypothetical protein